MLTTKNADKEVLVPTVISSGKTPTTLVAYPVKATTEISVEFRSSRDFPKLHIIFNGSTLTADPLSIKILDTGLPIPMSFHVQGLDVSSHLK